MPAPNRLAAEKSPYLQAHSRNPVDWYPWGPEAFDAARARDAPLFVSIGYSACHWCHVMERECFEDQEVARAMNRDLVSVKVDREELPAVDHLFMAYCQGMTGSGGWPLNVALTPEGKPFFAGTYFPKRSGFGRPGMLDLAPGIGLLWRDQREQVVRTADELERALAQQMRPVAGPLPGRGLIESTKDELALLYDARRGGFGAAPKFPTVPWLLFLMRCAERDGKGGKARVMVEQTLRAMRLGGIYDHLGYGFHRYSTDAGWLLPHFEKMLYDQALLALAYTEAYRLWADAAFRRTAEEIFAYVLRDLTAPQGGFAAAEDADSEGEEGRFYLWGLDEVTAQLGSEAAQRFAGAFHLRAEGNFTSESGDRSGRNVLHRIPPQADSAADLALAPGGLCADLEAARAALEAARGRRVRPHRDEKVLTDWNGLMVAALARGAAVFGEPAYAAAGAAAAEFVLARLRTTRGADGEGTADRRGVAGAGNRAQEKTALPLLLHRYLDGEAAFPAALDDHVFLAWGCLELHGATGQARWLEETRGLIEAMQIRFTDGADGLFFSAADPLLPLRQTIVTDSALPAGIGVAAQVLVRFGEATGETQHAERARRLIRAVGGSIERAPLGCAHLLSASMLLGD